MKSKDEAAAHLDIAAAERERCCKDVCGYCRGDMDMFGFGPAERHQIRGWEHAREGGFAVCAATEIRERVFRGQQAREGEAEA